MFEDLDVLVRLASDNETNVPSISAGSITDLPAHNAKN